MERPVSFSAEEIRDEKVLIVPWNHVSNHTWILIGQGAPCYSSY